MPNLSSSMVISSWLHNTIKIMNKNTSTISYKKRTKKSSNNESFRNSKHIREDSRILSQIIKAKLLIC